MPFSLVVKKGSKIRLLRCRVHSDAIVAHGEQDVGAGQHGIGVASRKLVVDFEVGGLDHQPAAFGHRVPCVHREIHDHLLDLALIGADFSERRVEACEQLDVFADEAPQHLFRVGNHSVEEQNLRFEDLLPTEGQELFRQRRGAVAGFDDLIDWRVASSRFRGCALEGSRRNR